MNKHQKRNIAITLVTILVLAASVALYLQKDSAETEQVTITESGYATLVSSHNLDFTSTPLTAYVATSFAEGKAEWKKAGSVKQGVGILLIAPEGTYSIPITDTYQDSISLLKGSAEQDLTIEKGTEAYILSCKPATPHEVRFFKAKPGTICKQGKAMLVKE